MTSESLAAALDTMPKQRQAIADGVATTETYDAVAQRVAVFEARAKGCAGLAAISADDWTSQQDHVLTCALCKPADPRRLRERVEYLAPGLVAVPEDEERRWLAFFHSPVRTVSDVVTRPVRALTDVITKTGADPQLVLKAAAGVVGFVVFLLAVPSSERAESPPSGQVVAEELPAGPADVPVTPPVEGPPAAPEPSAGPVVPAGQTTTTTTPVAVLPGTTDEPRPGTSTTDTPRPALANAWAYASTSWGQYDQPVGQQVEMDRRWQWGTWRRDGVERYLTLVRQGEGDYVVRVPELGGRTGTVHTELSIGWGYYQPFSCQTEGTRGDGRDLLVDVACFNANGTRRNLPFTVVFVSEGPAVHYRSGASGVTRTGPGQYEVTTLGGNGFAMVSPVGQNQARCRSTVEPARVKVACDAESDWNLTYTDNTAIHHDPSAPAAYLETSNNRSWSSNGETPTVTRTGVGRYDVQYKSIGNPKVWPGEAVLVSATGPEPRYCRIWAWNGYSYPPGVLVQIYCYDQAGAAADATFALAYVRSP